MPLHETIDFILRNGYFPEGFMGVNRLNNIKVNTYNLKDVENTIKNEYNDLYKINYEDVDFYLDTEGLLI